MISCVCPSHSRTYRSLLPSAFIALLTSIPIQAQETEIFHLDNGDRITGKIMEFESGEVRVKTRSMGFVYISWEDITQLESKRRLQFETEDGTRYYGSVTPSENSGSITLESVSKKVELSLKDVVRVQTVKASASWWDSLDKNLALGFNYSNASEVLHWNIAAGLEYTGLQSLAAISFNSIVNDSENSEKTRRAEITGSYTRLLSNRWHWFGTGSVQTNDELGIGRRFLVTSGFGRFVLQNDRTELSLNAGLAGNWERSTERQNLDQGYESSMEGLLEAKWSYFKLHLPRSRVELSVQYFPGISDAGRNRANGNLNLRQEFVEDLFWDLRLYGSYDSKPPQAALSKTDYGIVTSLDYQF